ncbi:E3 ubiquitin-protein ligase TRIM39-like [Boleophthalmus pectinirostris]|uniref:E3 ubiquitin-protein ligase TRIM39-like n=1 Tax=Boleophthalmus pectinirostris TaxID=150288 RepID=UPI00242FBB45|nr:E3 ubiquitin-protein ligase TRIM39-like [Boleophthalmus pectinirostris]XP_020786666.2 E3 ubiquitin-protein ligase TRIM39-like [Boleophthalmus pectinirostris]
MKMQEQSMDVKGISRFQNKTPLLEQDCQKGAEILAGNEINESSGITISSDNVKFSLRDLKAAKEKESYVLSGHGASESISFKTNQHNIMRADIGEMKEKCLERKGSGEFQNNSPSAKDSELYNYLKSKIIASNVTEVGLENDVLQNKTPHVSVLNMQKQNSSLRNNQEMTVHQSIGMEEPESPRIDQNLIAFNDEGDLESKENLAFQNKSLILAEKMAELKLKLMSKASDLTNKLENAEMVLKKEQECKRAVTMAHAKLRENALKLVGELTSFAQNYSKTIMELIEQELSPGEEMLHNKVEKASEVCKKIKKTMHEVDNLLKEKDANVFTSKIQSLESEIEGCKETKQPEENQELKFDLTKVCPELEQLSCEFRDKLGQVQRSLRSEFNPSEVTFDPETLHPNLILSEDLKMVTFSAKKQQYDPTPKRFTNFIQALSAQSFSAGVHRWEVQLDCAPWLLGICVASSLPRSGLPSALEMSPSSWGLMWNQSLLSAFHQSRTTQLQKTPLVSRRVELKLDCDRGQLDFYYLSETSGRHHIHMFKIDTREPLHLAYRMLSGDPKGRATICS